MTHGKKTLLSCLATLGTVGVLLGSVASASQPKCYKLYACGSANDGGYLYCVVEC